MLLWQPVAVIRTVLLGRLFSNPLPIILPASRMQLHGWLERMNYRNRRNKERTMRKFDAYCAGRLILSGAPLTEALQAVQRVMWVSANAVAAAKTHFEHSGEDFSFCYGFTIGCVREVTTAQ